MLSDMQALPIFLDRIVDPVIAIVLSVTAVLIFGEECLSRASSRLFAARCMSSVA